MKNFRTYHLALEFYKLSQTLKLPRHLKDQLDRASSSIVLNLAEGRYQSTAKNQRRFFHIALGSLRECQAVMDLIDSKHIAVETADSLAAHIYKLIKNMRV